MSNYELISPYLCAKCKAFVKQKFPSEEELEEKAAFYLYMWSQSSLYPSEEALIESLPKTDHQTYMCRMINAEISLETNPPHECIICDSVL